jgi:hypothetical protein
LITENVDAKIIEKYELEFEQPKWFTKTLKQQKE